MIRSILDWFARDVSGGELTFVVSCRRPKPLLELRNDWTAFIAIEMSSKNDDLVEIVMLRESCCLMSAYQKRMMR